MKRRRHGEEAGMERNLQEKKPAWKENSKEHIAKKFTVCYDKQDGFMFEMARKTNNHDMLKIVRKRIVVRKLIVNREKQG